jgi:nucleoside-diphosphate-sugar epimerase
MAPAIPKDSIVLVTGVNGYIGSHVADQLLEAGYRIRGTCRSASKAQALSDLWRKKYGQGRFEIVAVPDMSKEGAFDEAVKGITQLLRKNVID